MKPPDYNAYQTVTFHYHVQLSLLRFPNVWRKVIFENILNSQPIFTGSSMWEKLGCNPDWRIVMANYLCMFVQWTLYGWMWKFRNQICHNQLKRWERLELTHARCDALSSFWRFYVPFGKTNKLRRLYFQSQVMLDLKEACFGSLSTAAVYGSSISPTS